MACNEARGGVRGRGWMSSKSFVALWYDVSIKVSRCRSVIWLFFFFQAEDGIRDYKVTGVQTCALPISTQRYNLTGAGDPREVQAAAVTADLFDVLQLRPEIGHGFAAADDRTPLALLSHGLWVTNFGRDPGILGRAISLDGNRKSTRLNSSHLVISYAVFCLKKKKKSSPERLAVVRQDQAAHIAHSTTPPTTRAPRPGLVAAL